LVEALQFAGAPPFGLEQTQVQGHVPDTEPDRVPNAHTLLAGDADGADPTIVPWAVPQIAFVVVVEMVTGFQSSCSVITELQNDARFAGGVLISA
jgi:hypothetical protein